MTAIRDRLAAASDLSRRFLCGRTVSICLDDILHGTSLGGHLPELANRTVLVAARHQLATALTLIELDGVVRRLVICPPDVPAEHLPSVIANAGVDAIVSDCDLPGQSRGNVPLLTVRSVPVAPATVVTRARAHTEWVFLTSGTTGAPKMVAHRMAGLTAAVESRPVPAARVVWSTFYDIRRFGGLQIFLRAVLGGGSLVLSDSDESLEDFLSRLATHEVTHISGTPSHWRRALMSPLARTIAPGYVRLSGEVADQAILNALRSVYPKAAVVHAFASTEAGVGFEVSDGLEGFPASYVAGSGDLELRIDQGSLRIRSARTAIGYLGPEAPAIADEEGFVDTGDMVELRGDRYYFLGRRSGVINIGGLKVYPEEVEAVINQHPAVRMSMVRSRNSPITGSLIAADVVLRRQPGARQLLGIEQEILRICRERLGAHKVPTAIRFVAALNVAPAGKLARHHG